MTARSDFGPRRAAPETSLWRPLEAIVRPLDAVRRWSWWISAKTTFGRACLRDRSLRLTTLALTHMLVAATLVVIAPVWLLLIGPIVLGVPHVASDIRYLLINPPLPLGRRGLVLLLGPLMAMTALRVAAALGAPYLAELEVFLGAAAMLGGVALAPATPMKKALAAVAILAVTAFAMSVAHDSLLVIAHLHNLVAFGLWLWLFRSETSLRAIALIAATYLAVIMIFMSGVADAALLGHALSSDIGHFGLAEMADTLAPSFDFEIALRLVAVYAFAQAVHYVVWLRLIPQRLDTRTAPPTIKRSVQRLRFDFGRIGFALIVIFSVLTPLATLAFDGTEVRTLYLLAAIAHGWIELAIIAALLTRGRPRLSV